MADNFNALRIQTFTGINDNPIAPTASKAGNGSHIIAQFNSLIDDLNVKVKNSDWQVIDSHYEAKPQDKLLLNFADNYIALYLPANPNPRDEIRLLKVCDENHMVEIGLNENKYFSSYPSLIELYSSYIDFSLIYIDSDQGWVTTQPNVLSVRYSSGT